MNDVSGLLDCLEPHKDKWSLGISLTHDGNYAAKLQFQKEQTLFWASQILHSKAPWHVTWLNFKILALKKVEYPLMVTTFSHSKGNDILCPAINTELPALGINCHFPCNMIDGHANHFDMVIPNLYDSQGFLHLSALFKFGTLPCPMGQGNDKLMKHFRLKSAHLAIFS